MVAHAPSFHWRYVPIGTGVGSAGSGSARLPPPGVGMPRRVHGPPSGTRTHETFRPGSSAYDHSSATAPSGYNNRAVSPSSLRPMPVVSLKNTSHAPG